MGGSTSVNEMNQPVVLVVDDEPDIRELLQITLKRMHLESRTAADLGEARELLAKEQFDLCLTDMRLPDGNGLDLVAHIQKRYAETPVAVITAHGNMETAISALKLGAFDFVTKPVDLEALRSLVQSAMRVSSGGRRKRDVSTRLIGDSAAMERTRATIGKLARSQAPVYISGESGTGKELVARTIHEQGPRAGNAFVPVNCGAIPQDLLESEFFGHKKGSFTGAVTDKPGLFETAQGGTLFLDEIAELPLQMQVKLLRAIQEKAVRPVGAQREVKVDVRILSATHKDLAALVKEGRFREDLFYRINVIELNVPPLRERLEDLPALTAFFLDKLSNEQGLPPPELCAQALRALQNYPFPGNVRELENILERAVTLCEGQAIETDDLQLKNPLADAATDAQEAGGTVAAEAPATADGLGSYLDAVEKRKILAALEETRWNKTAAAKRLGISFGALRYRLQKLGLD
jgi:two-component system response regulator PilR (NtrC family)